MTLPGTITAEIETIDGHEVNFTMSRITRPRFKVLMKLPLEKLLEELLVDINGFPPESDDVEQDVFALCALKALDIMGGTKPAASP